MVRGEPQAQVQGQETAGESGIIFLHSRTRQVQSQSKPISHCNTPVNVAMDGKEGRTVYLDPKGSNPFLCAMGERINWTVVE